MRDKTFIPMSQKNTLHFNTWTFKVSDKHEVDRRENEAARMHNKHKLQTCLLP